MPGDRRILHIDMDAYFAALEVRACPVLKGKPLVVGALPDSRGVVASASYEAREFGIRAGMPAAHAKRLCPHVEFVPCHPALYIHTSRKILEHFLSFTPKVEMFSIDEAFLDVTDMLPSSPDDAVSWRETEALARDIAGSLQSTIDLSSSVGVGPNKLIAKMASKVKKPRGITVLSKESFRRMFWHKMVEELFGVGPQTSSSLMILGVEKIGELAETPAQFLRSRFGVFGDALHAMAWGEDETPVVAFHETAGAKSLGHEHTLSEDVGTPEEGLSLLLALTDRVAHDLRHKGYAGRRVAVKMRYSDFSTLSRQRVLAHPTQETRDLYRTAKELFLGHYCGGGIRLLGVTVGELTQTQGRSQINLFPEDRRYTRYLETVDRVRDSFGRESLQPAGGMRSSEVGHSQRGGDDASGKEIHGTEKSISV